MKINTAAAVQLECLYDDECLELVRQATDEGRDKRWEWARKQLIGRHPEEYAKQVEAAQRREAESVEKQRGRIRAAMRARTRAVRDLIAIHGEEFDVLYGSYAAEEGVTPRGRRTTTTAEGTRSRC